MKIDTNEQNDIILEALQDYRKWFEENSDPAWTEKIELIDQVIESIRKPDIIKITISGGCLQDVEGIPSGYDYELNDLDNKEAEAEEVER